MKANERTLFSGHLIGIAVKLVHDYSITMSRNISLCTIYSTYGENIVVVYDMSISYQNQNLILLQQWHQDCLFSLSLNLPIRFFINCLHQQVNNVHHNLEPKVIKYLISSVQNLKIFSSNVMLDKKKQQILTSEKLEP